MKLSVKLGLISLIFSNVVYAVNPVPGWYAGIMLGGSYQKPTDLVFINPITFTTEVGTVKYSGYGDIGLQLGYRINEFRIELEPLVNYNPYHSITVGSTTFTGRTVAPGYRLKGASTTYALMLNGIYDFYTACSGGDTGFAPYVGLGIGAAHVMNGVKFYDNSTGQYISGTRISDSTTVPAAQGIIGLGYFMDDFTWFGLDYRYITSKKITATDSRLQINTINLSFNGSLCL